MRNSLVAAVVAASLACSVGVVAQPSRASAEIAAIRAEIAGLMARLERLEQRRRPPQCAPAATRQRLPRRTGGRDPRRRGDAARDPVFRRSALPPRDDQRGRGSRAQPASSPCPVRRYGRHRRERSRRAPTRVRHRRSGIGQPDSRQGFNRKPIGIDRAFFSWAATEQLTFTGGKIANPFFRPGNHHLIYDSDLNPEGLALRYGRGDWFANYAGLWVEERSAADDSIMLGGQFGYRHTLDNGMRVTAGASYYDYLETQGPHSVLGWRSRRQSARSGGGYSERLQSHRVVRGAQPEGRRAPGHACSRITS